MQILSWFAIAFYAFIVPLLLLSWVGYLQQEPELEADERKLSIAVIAIAIVLWPLALPFAYLNLMEQLKHTKSKIRLYQQIAKIDSSSSP